MFAEAGSSSSDLKGLLGICGKQYCDFFFFLFYCIFHMASGKEKCHSASHVKSLPCSGNMASVNQFPQSGFTCQGNIVLPHCLSKSYYQKHK